MKQLLSTIYCCKGVKYTIDLALCEHYWLTANTIYPLIIFHSCFHCSLCPFVPLSPLSIPWWSFVSQQLNDGGKLISEMVKNDKELGQSGVDIRVWTGDTMTAASVYQQLVALPDLQQLFYIGANGKIGTAVCQKLVQRGISLRIFSKYEGIYLFVYYIAITISFYLFLPPFTTFHTSHLTSS